LILEFIRLLIAKINNSAFLFLILFYHFTNQGCEAIKEKRERMRGNEEASLQADETCKELTKEEEIELHSGKINNEQNRAICRYLIEQAGLLIEKASSEDTDEETDKEPTYAYFVACKKTPIIYKCFILTHLIIR
jgi:hypothetical protein